jgi:hypothetical protein
MPGRETEYTCSMPAMREKHLLGRPRHQVLDVGADAPGKGTKTLAIVTLICGSSSRGVTSTANRPSRKAISAMSGVICERWNRAAIFPEMPMVQLSVADAVAGSKTPHRSAGFSGSDNRDTGNWGSPPCGQCDPALTGSSATFSPALKPASTSWKPPGVWPPTVKGSESRTWRRRAAFLSSMTYTAVTSPRRSTAAAAPAASSPCR